ncbi:MAG: sigma-70 family RNA polymerase sigma factor [Acidobacteriaceae bacterium]|nr:sigma-70 family RNA polymerase sigma factor [Acidobacteriaceae bacterium]MBV9779768.1 sigma-70 family RNA polymerase sigma factor [Acidobacteriaceae bacterium]
MPSHEKADAQLIDLLRKRDAEGLAAAYDRYGRIAYSLFLRITRDQSASEDLVQELFIRLWNRGREFDASKGTLGVWILSIARNMAIDHVRSAQARLAGRSCSIELIDKLSMSAHSADPESIIDRARSVDAGFRNLNANEKRVLELAYFEGLSQSEIAARLKEPLGTVKSWTRSALGRMRRAIQGASAQESGNS